MNEQSEWDLALALPNGCLAQFFGCGGDWGCGRRRNHITVHCKPKSFANNKNNCSCYVEDVDTIDRTSSTNVVCWFAFIASLIFCTRLLFLQWQIILIYLYHRNIISVILASSHENGGIKSTYKAGRKKTKLIQKGVLKNEW